MVRSYWKGTLVAALSWGGLALGQSQPQPVPVSIVNPTQPLPASTSGPELIGHMPAPSTPAAPQVVNPNDRIMTIQEPGKPPQQCRIVREWRLRDGNTAKEVVTLDTGETLTVVEGGSIAGAPDAYPLTRLQGRVSQIFHWNGSKTAPAGVPVAPPGTAVASQQPAPQDKDKGPFNFDSYLTSLRHRNGSKELTDNPPLARPDGAAVAAKPGDIKLPTTLAAQPETPKTYLNVADWWNRVRGVETVKVTTAPNSMPSLPTTTVADMHKTTVSEPSKTTVKTTVSEPSKTTVKATVPEPFKTTVKTTVPDVHKTTVADAHKTTKPVESHSPLPPPQTFWERWFGDDKDQTNGSFDRDKYLADMRAKKGGHDASFTKAADTVAAKPVVKPADTVAVKPVVKPAEKVADKDKTEVVSTSTNKPASKPPTVTPPKPVTPPTTVVAKPPVEPPQPSDWRRSWGKTDSTQVKGEKDDKSKTDVVKTDDKSKTEPVKDSYKPLARPAVSVSASPTPPPQKDLPQAAPRIDPLMAPELYAKKPEPKPETPAASPLMGGPAAEVKPAVAHAQPGATQPVQQVAMVEGPGKSSTAKVPMGAGSVMAAFDGQGGQVVYVPVPMVTVPPTAHMPRPPQSAPGLPPQVNDAVANAFSGSGGAPSMPPGYPNAFQGQPMMDPMPMAYNGMPPMMPMNPMNPYAGQMARAMVPPGYAGYGAPAMMPAAYYPPMMPAAPATPAAPPADPQAATHLMQTLHDALYPSQREWAAETLAGMDWRSHPQVFDALLTAAREDPAPTVRTCCVRCLTGMNINSGLLTMTLQSLKADADPRVRSEVEQALAKLPPAPLKTGNGEIRPASAIMPEK